MGEKMKNTIRELDDLKDEMDRLLDKIWNNNKKMKTEIGQPSVDIENRKDKVILHIDLPGIDKKDVDVNVQSKKVIVRGDRKAEKEIKKKDYYQKERSYSGFYRSVPLPAIVIPEKAKSEFKNGTLKVTIPKNKQVPKKRSS